MAEQMPRAAEAEVLHHDGPEGRRALTFDRDYGEHVFTRAVPRPPAIVYLRKGAYAPEWPVRIVLDLLPQADCVAGYLVVVSGRALHRWPLSPA